MTPSAASAAVNPPDVQEYLRHLSKERDVSPNTVKAYDRDRKSTRLNSSHT